ncbi:FxsA family protein [Helicobacter sp. faydin-H20]|uniref:FxsA family protein n=1 Tax=Helicobacter anatolicus TaxID=2905874 RepID=UPI001E644165|nr:FxsA family protein [Helicobacter anatolicus]MCE3037291.1 FxsA family protein [Helicobacter anatolicus]
MKILKFIFLYFVLELISTIYLSDKLGFWVIFVEIIISALIGGAILFYTKLSFLETLGEFALNRTDPMEFIKGNLSKIFGAILLILPGVLGDIIGLVILINACFFIVGKSKKINSGDRHGGAFGHQNEIIDVEIEEIKQIKGKK